MIHLYFLKKWHFATKIKAYMNGNDDTEQSTKNYEMIALFTKLSIKIP